jgi:hypothetical protein
LETATCSLTAKLQLSGLSILLPTLPICVTVDMIKDVKKVQSELENKYVSYVPVIDKAAEALSTNRANPNRRIGGLLTEYSVNESNNMTARMEKTRSVPACEIH